MTLVLSSVIFFFNQKTAYEMRISDWSSDVCSSDLLAWRTRHGWSPRSNARLLSALRAFFGHRVRQGQRKDDPTALLEPPKLRSEEHTSELQSLMRISYAVFCLKKKKYTTHKHIPHSKRNTQM